MKRKDYTEEIIMIWQAKDRNLDEAQAKVPV